MTFKSTLTALALCLGGAAQASVLNVSITNEQDAGGLYLTPVLVVLHDGSYDAFDTASNASAGVEAIAETGNPATEQATLGTRPNAVAGNAAGFPGAPVLDPGETATFQINVDPTSDRYLSFLSMVIPSNDLFIGNDNPFAYEVFDAAGNFQLTSPISVLTSQVWDAGTEANDNLGAAFNAAGGTATDTTDMISLAGDLSFLIGQNTAAMTTVTGIGSRLASITVAPVPLPASVSLLLAGLGGLAIARRRKRVA